MTDTGDAPPPRRRGGDSLLVALIAIPLAVAAFAYVGDVILGARGVMLPGMPRRGLEAYAAITIAFCAIEIVIAAFMLLRRRRLAAFIGLACYLAVVSFAMLLLGAFRA